MFSDVPEAARRKTRDFYARFVDDDRGGSSLCRRRGERSWTYGSYSDEVSRRRDSLADAEKRLLFLFCRNDLPSVAWYLAAMEAGHAVALLNDQVDAQLAANLISLYRPDWVLASLPVDQTEYESPGAAGFWRRRRLDRHRFITDLALLLSTSGSTGSPKFVRLRRDNVEANAESIRQALTSAKRCAVAHLQIHYSYGLSVVNSYLLRCIIAASREGLVSQTFWEAIRRYRVDSFSGVPYTYQMLRRLGLDKVNAPTLRIMTQAGGKLDTGNIAHFHERIVERQGEFLCDVRANGGHCAHFDSAFHRPAAEAWAPPAAPFRAA